MAGLALLLGQLGLPGTQAASANCGSGSFGQNYIGVKRNPSGARSSGAQASIEVRESALCDPPAGTLAQATAFAGLFEDVSGGGWAWVGWQRLTGLGRDGVISIRQSGGSAEVKTTIGSVALGDKFTYKTTWQNGGDNRIHFIVCEANGTNCTDFGRTSFDGDIWGDIEGRVVGNTNTNDADVPGIVGSRNDYTDILWRDGTGTWGTAVSSNITQGPNRYKLNVIDSGHIQTWTDPV